MPAHESEGAPARTASPKCMSLWTWDIDPGKRTAPVLARPRRKMRQAGSPGFRDVLEASRCRSGLLDRRLDATVRVLGHVVGRSGRAGPEVVLHAYRKTAALVDGHDSVDARVVADGMGREVGHGHAIDNRVGQRLARIFLRLFQILARPSDRSLDRDRAFLPCAAHLDIHGATHGEPAPSGVLNAFAARGSLPRFVQQREALRGGECRLGGSSVGSERRPCLQNTIHAVDRSRSGWPISAESLVEAARMDDDPWRADPTR